MLIHLRAAFYKSILVSMAFSLLGVTIALAASGDLDSTFSGNGWARADFALDVDKANDIAIQPDGKIVSAGPQDVRGSNAIPIRPSVDGHVDTLATIARLQEMNANTHMFLINKQQDWDDLRLEFAREAQKAGIKVWVYLRSPSVCMDEECSNYAPYGKHYEDWAAAIARLSRRYPVVTAWSIDDFANGNNLSFFTPSYMAQIRALSRAIQPTLEFYPVVYYNFISPIFLAFYAPLMDALIMPYRDDPYRNTLWTKSLGGQLSTVETLLASHDRKLILMVYARNLSNTQVTPDVDYVRRIATIGMQETRAGTIAGVVQYGIPLIPDRPGHLDVNFSHGTGNGAFVLTVREKQKTSAGDWAGAAAHIQLNSGSTSCRLGVWHRDNRGAPTMKFGYHFKQIVVAGRVMWSRDIFNDDTEWHSTSMDLTPLMTHGTVQLILRLYEKKGVSNLHVRARFDDISLTGCSLVGGNTSFESIGSWRFIRRGGPVLAGQHIYDPQYSTSVFDMIAQMYAQ